MNDDPLAALRPLHLPEPVGWWPPAPLWWLLAALVLGLLACGARLAWRHWRRNRYRRAARAELKAAWSGAPEPREFAARAATILRRAALVRYGHAAVAALADTAWLDFLDRSARMQGFAAGPGSALARAPYDPAASCDAAALERLCRRWIGRHR